jgi:GMP reductase
MHIESDIKLGFKDVMLRPKRSTLSSRSEVSLIRKFKFLHSGSTWEGIPIMAANMDTVGTMEIAKALAGEKLFTAIHKYYTPSQWKAFMQKGGDSITEYIAVSTGTSTGDAKKTGYNTHRKPFTTVHLH